MILTTTGYWKYLTIRDTSMKKEHAHPGHADRCPEDLAFRWTGLHKGRYSMHGCSFCKPVYSWFLLGHHFSLPLMESLKMKLKAPTNVWKDNLLESFHPFVTFRHCLWSFDHTCYVQIWIWLFRVANYLSFWDNKIIKVWLNSLW